ncbi:olfactory receptor 52B2-like [Aulostomus maculatus]
MYPNVSSSNLLTLESLALPAVYIYPAFIFGTITYLIIVICNLSVFLSIAMTKKLHKPMFLLLFNLPISDMVGATAFFPHFVSSILTQNRQMSYSACMTQGFLIHFYGSANLLILSAMSYDRYIAICCPLQYNAILTPHRLAKIISSIWILSFSIMFVLFMLLARFKICRRNLVDLYCNNPSLLKLVCDDTRVNNYYGLSFIVFLQGGSLAIIAYTYMQILRTCVMGNNLDTRRKAIQTCGTHLVVFLTLQVNTLITLLSHRSERASPFLRRSLGLSVLIFPPFLDPIIYGIKIKALKQTIVLFLKGNSCRKNTVTL